MGACARNMQSDPAEIKPAQCCIKLVFHLTYTVMHGSTKLKKNRLHCFLAYRNSLPRSYSHKFRSNVINGTRKVANYEALRYAGFLRRQYLISLHQIISRGLITDRCVRPKNNFLPSILGQDGTLVLYLGDLAFKTAVHIWSFLWYSSVPPNKISVQCLVLAHGCFNPQTFETIIRTN